jgi:NADH-quinone oxidoreductase subunit M
MSGVIITAAYHLWAMQRIQLGPWNEHRWKDRTLFFDVTAREALTLVPLALLVLLLGFWPMPLLALSESSVADLLRHLTNNAAAGALAGLP